VSACVHPTGPRLLTAAEDGTIPWLAYREAETGAPRRYEHVLTNDVRRRTGL